jgi:hypothetical protein
MKWVDDEAKIQPNRSLSENRGVLLLRGSVCDHLGRKGAWDEVGRKWTEKVKMRSRYSRLNCLQDQTNAVIVGNGNGMQRVAFLVPVEWCVSGSS